MNSRRFPSARKPLWKIRFTTQTPSLTLARPKIRLARIEPTKPAGAVKANSYYDKNKSGKVSFRKGDIVAVRRKPNTTGESTKTHPRYRGPMVVTQVRPSDTYRISQLEPSNGHPYATIVHVSQLKAWRSWNEVDDDSSTNSRNEPEMQRSKRTVRKPLRYGDIMPNR
ncbi:hypothetical protein AVEN_23351-1 [Araneus ventricosus]|uniref:Uncharacterized protein n=1 Tax=Araneus ventricosus TaxID=182803 RepID=A0A4Y2FT17_ARAVE|nr:hypothetical protein AVEN_23351-1 [Araneus ventricosus]